MIKENVRGVDDHRFPVMFAAFGRDRNGAIQSKNHRLRVLLFLSFRP